MTTTAQEDRNPGPSKMHVLLYEPNHTGHHFAYLGWMLPGFLKLPIRVTIATTPEAVNSREFELAIKPHVEQVNILPSCRPLLQGAPFANARRRLADLRSAVHESQPDHVGLFYADGLWELFAAGATHLRHAKGVPTTEAWVFRGGFSYDDASRWFDKARRYLWNRLLRSGRLTKLNLHDELLLEHSRTVRGAVSEYALVPDPVEIGPTTDLHDARQRLELPTDGRILGCIGVADKRKGVHLALAAFEQLTAHEAPNDSQKMRLLLAGPHSEEIRGMLGEPRFCKLVSSRSIVSLDRYLSKDEMHLSAAACDLVLAPYPRQSGRSSIILWAANAGRPVVGAARGCIGHVIREERLGRVCNVLDPSELAATIRAVFTDPWRQEDAQRARAYARWHSIENYQELCAAWTKQQCEQEA